MDDDQDLTRLLGAQRLALVALAEALAQDLEAQAARGEPLEPEAMLRRAQRIRVRLHGLRG